MATGRRWRRAAAGSIALCAAAAPAAARPTAELLDWGRVDGVRGAAPGPGEEGTGLAPALPMSHQSVVERTDAIEARLCRSFGMMLRILPGPGEREPEGVVVHVIHPLLTRPDGATSTEDAFASLVVFGHTYAGFTFDHGWEMRPGDWTFVVVADGAVVATKRFRVTLPPAGAPASDCGAAVS